MAGVLSDEDGPVAMLGGGESGSESDEPLVSQPERRMKKRRDKVDEEDEDEEALALRLLQG